jgi:23S rRNA (guanosine2251-2'-O)-methyltransferase
LKTKKSGLTGKSRSDCEWIYGLNPVMEAIRAGRIIKRIVISTARHDKGLEVRKEAESRHISVEFADPVFFDNSFSKGHQGIAAEASPKDYIDLEDLIDIPFRKNEPALFIILDCIEDPRNLGAVLRVADAAGVHGIVMQSHRSATLGLGVSKVSAGAVEYIPVSIVANIKHAFNAMKKRGINIIGAEANASNTIWDAPFTEPLALVIGSEGKGLRKTVSDQCDILVSIPMYGKINSLNVSVATGILVFEILRQRVKNF